MDRSLLGMEGVVSFDKYDHHEYGLIRISEREYVRCSGACCKSGGPAFGRVEHDDPDE